MSRTRLKESAPVRARPQFLADSVEQVDLLGSIRSSGSCLEFAGPAVPDPAEWTDGRCAYCGLRGHSLMRRWSWWLPGASVSTGVCRSSGFFCEARMSLWAGHWTMFRADRFVIQAG